jgi:hypothetical protein
MANTNTDDKNHLELLKIIRKFIEKELVFVRAEMINQENRLSQNFH